MKILGPPLTPALSRLGRGGYFLPLEGGGSRWGWTKIIFALKPFFKIPSAFLFQGGENFSPGKRRIEGFRNDGESDDLIVIRYV
jgi:hypothetical protein